MTDMPDFNSHQVLSNIPKQTTCFRISFLFLYWLVWDLQMLEFAWETNVTWIIKTELFINTDTEYST